MKEKKIIVVCFLIFLAACSNGKNELTQTFIGNCGFMYESGSHKVLIDPFGTQYGGFFHLPSTGTLNKITNCESPFEDIDLLLVTHVHGDHFDPFLTEKFLSKNLTAKMVCPPQVLQMMRDSCKHFEALADRILSPVLEMAETKKMAVKGIPMTVIRTQHGSGRDLTTLELSDYSDYEKTENYAYVILLNKKRIFHQGDTDLKFNREAFSAVKKPLDLAYLSFFDWDSASYSLLENELQAKNIVFMHGTKPAEELNRDEFIDVKSEILFFDEMEKFILK